MGTGLRTLDYESDHMAVLLETDRGTLQSKNEMEVFNFSRMNITRFKRRLAEEIGNEILPTDRNVSIREIDGAVVKLTDAFRTVMDETIRKFHPRGDGFPDLPADIMDLIRQKKRMRRRLAESNGEINVLTNRPGETIVADQEKVELLADEFLNVQRGVSDIDGQMDENITDFSTPLVTFGQRYFADGTVIQDSPNIPLRLIKTGEMENYLRRLNNKRSSGHDGIPNYILKRAGGHLAGISTVIFNHCFSTQLEEVYYSADLENTMGKLFEIAILERLNDRIEDSNILLDCQFGFRKETSTEHALTLLTDSITMGLNDRCATIASRTYPDESASVSVATTTPKYSGPYEVTERSSKYFKIRMGRNEENVTVDRLKPAYVDDNTTSFETHSRTKPVVSFALEGEYCGDTRF
ncbi:uncharacterized protein LOC142231457 [Haematobia irritans]|uniref:uncharacterized protein LOC142231457 n=1 Tax=Haematobia irritans TaxID=7368 RepID=UPI003F50A2BB